MSNAALNEMVSQLNETQKERLHKRTGSATPGVAGRQCDIAIIGISGRYPLSRNHYEFWDKLNKGTNFIGNVPETRWDHRLYYTPDPGISSDLGKTRCNYGAFIGDHTAFDASFFGLSEDEAEFVQPQDRIALETSWACIEDAGYNPDDFNRETGVFAGLTNTDYQKTVSFNSHLCFLVNRISYFYDFQGPAMVTDTGCSSSLTAIHLACQNLTGNDCRTALVIGANIILHPDHYTGASHMLSPSKTPASNPFGTDDGWFPAEGVVAILLKPLPAAIQDNDHIYGVIKSSHVGQEGKTARFTASNPGRHSALIRENFRKSGIHPETISYVESAANGSSFGDAIEIEGLKKAFGQCTNRRGVCPVGSVKANVGHGEGVSTLLALTKLLLQFKTKSIYPVLNLNQKNPKIKELETPFYFPTRQERWEPPAIRINGRDFKVPRRATISSFGAGGMFGHLIVEEHRRPSQARETLNSYFIPLSAASRVQQETLLRRYAHFFNVNQEIDGNFGGGSVLMNMMFTLCRGRKHFDHRIVFIVSDLKTLKGLIQKFLKREEDDSIVVAPEGESPVNGEMKAEADLQELMASQEWPALAKLWVNGCSLKWDRFFRGRTATRIPLPTYCFKRNPQHINTGNS